MTLLSISQMTMDLLPDLTVYIRNTVGVLQEAGTVNPSRASRFTPFVLVWFMLLIFLVFWGFVGFFFLTSFYVL